ncbi:20024_t:CDS:2 [Gigaspora margarita]|uniref:20024_t:CDS:1 n=1 Tax=Gigaspora margarita TaxID=4874 RepID=A0ABN7VJI5_GIGMA|nr:20024_t:CDS:2 [Gigaspora margarita]
MLAKWLRRGNDCRENVLYFTSLNGIVIEHLETLTSGDSNYLDPLVVSHLQGRGRGGATRGRGGRDGRSGRGGYSGFGGGDKPKKESILDLSKYMDKKIRVKFNGGREVTGSLKGYDPLLNLVLDDTEEQLRDDVRSLGLIVCRGPAVILISPVDGTEEIANPFVQE